MFLKRQRSTESREFAFLILAAAVSFKLAYGADKVVEPVSTGEGTSLQELLDGYGLDSSRFQSFVDGRPVEGDELEALYRILFRLPQIAPEIIERDVSSAESRPSRDTPMARGRVYRMTGRVVRVEKLRLIPELTDRYHFDQFFRLRIADKHRQSEHVVFARFVPTAWQQTESLDEPCSFDGMLLKFGAAGQDGPELYFATGRIRWHPDRASEQFGIAADHVILARLGMDIGLLDGLQDRRRLDSADRECFYRLLEITKRLTRRHLAAARNADIARVLRYPGAHRGRFFRLRGTARRAVRIFVDDPDIQSRYGIDHYFELQVFIPLERPVQFVDSSRDTDGRLFTTFPVTVCVNHLPSGMPWGDEIRAEVSVTGVFYKLWAYGTEFMQTESGVGTSRRLQVGPLFLATRPEQLEQVARDPTPVLVFVMFLFGGIVLIGITVWQLDRRHRGLHRAVKSNDESAIDLSFLSQIDSTQHGQRNE